ncbi:MAG: potassium channel family protein [Acidimicrobiia bacterium]
MRLVLVGGGKVGSYLARELRDAGHLVTVIEPDERRVAELSDAHDLVVFSGDGTDVRLLEAADVGRADWVLGVTGHDEVNLVACQLGRTKGAANVIARLNDPRNRPTFEALDVPVVGVTRLMAQVISREIEIPDLSRVALLGEGQISLVERVVPEGFPTTRLAELDLPTPSILVSVTRDGSVSVPNADTVLAPGDRVLAVTDVECEQAFCDAFDPPGADDG